MTATSNVPVRVVRRLGLFAVAVPSVKNAAGTAASADGAIGSHVYGSQPGAARHHAIHREVYAQRQQFDIVCREPGAIANRLG